MQYVKIVNRTTRKLRATWDGRVYEIAPGAHSFPQIVADAFKRQNPIMGSEDPYDMVMDYLVGIEEAGDPITPLTDEEAFPKELERWNRKKLIGAKPSEVVAGKAGLYAHEKNTSISSLGQATGGFVNPNS
jgi:hypothetical protein